MRPWSDYLETCAGIGKPPQKPYSGRMMLVLPSVLKIAGGPCARASARVHTERGQRTKHLPAGPILDRDQVQESAVQRNVRHVGAPGLVRTFDRSVASK